MPRFLDQNSSMNFSGPVGVASAVAVPTALVLTANWGGIGLSTQFVPTPTVDLAGTITVSAIATALVTINVVRNPSSSPVIIYTLTKTFLAADSGSAISFNAQDLGAPAAQQTAYASYVTAAVAGTATRVGPETLWGIAADRTTG
ncbi:hypothetical protein L1N85_18475 [Paenibacillus alkaliterrae]|uniref:hypothetical protein n=1 Tax=Paenibacillus alkaliterrae TaxID=320909 RepID=UPI001F28492B|nr:hypothetical protein [Paenibacillus alkaliterrae]MCF2940389.1 hypothetical protein [Paenibacillus alkaliterrae]